MATFRVVLTIEVDDDDIIKSRDEESLESLKKNSDGDSYLEWYVKDEMTWLHQSFGYVKVESVERIEDEGSDAIVMMESDVDESEEPI